MEYEKEILFNEWFTTEVRMKASASKSFDTCIRINQHALRSHFENLYQKYKSRMNYDDFISECIYWAYVALDKFTLLDGDWDGILDGTDKKNMGKLITYIKSTVQSNAIRFANPNTRFTTRNIGGKRQNAKIVLTYTSLDTLITNEDGSQTALVEFMEDNANLFGNPAARYHMSAFVEWFHANKHTFLKKNQLLLLENLPRALNENDNTFNGELLRKEAKIRGNHVNYYLDNIKLRTMEAWEASKKEQRTMLNTMTKQSKKLKGYLTLIDQEETTDLEAQEWIKKGCNKEEWLEDICQKNLPQPLLINLNRCLKGLDDLQRPTLYAVNENIWRAAEHLDEKIKEEKWKMLTTPVPEEKKLFPKTIAAGNTFYLDTYGNELHMDTGA